MALSKPLDARELWIACCNGNIEKVKAHGALGGDLNLRYAGTTGLMNAAGCGQRDVVEWLVRAPGIEIDAQSDYDGRTALHWAAYNGEADCVLVLLEAGASALLKDKQGRTALELAQAENKSEVVAVMQQHAAAPPAPQPEPQPQPQPQPEPQPQPQPQPQPEPQPQPQPQPAVEEAEPPEVVAWLAAIGLPQYAPQIKEYGYDQMAVLYDATEADIVEMTEDADVKMKKPHRRTFVAKWKVLLAAAAPAGGQAAAPPATPPAAAGGAAPAGGAAGGAFPPSPAAAALAATPAAIPDKYIAAENQLYLGKAADSTHGLEVLLGI
eukprot:COSAG02_NODE_10565_length_1912_cov_34.194705_1_plen_323_part_10